MEVGDREPRTASRTWPSFLRGKTPEELLPRLVEGDPLRLQEQTALRLRQVWFLLDPDRVFRRALAVCAHAAPLEDPPSDLDAWRVAKVDLAVAQLLQSDQQRERSDPDTLSDEERSFPLLTQSLFVEPGSVRAVSVAFNALDPPPRRAFFELLVEGRNVDDVIEAGPWDADGLYRAIHQALAPFGLDLPIPAEGPSKWKGKKRS